MSKPTETKRYVYHSKTWVPVGPQTREEGEEEAMLNELAEVKERILRRRALERRRRAIMGDPISYPIKLVELEGVDGLYGTLRYVLMRDHSTSAERFQAAKELLYRLGAVGKERDAFESMILDILEANFEGAKEETERKVAEWQKEWDKKYPKTVVK